MKHLYKKMYPSAFIALGLISLQAQTTTENYVKTIECLDATCTTKKESVIYYDGLGREKQALQVGGSPTGKTIVTQFEYDGFGRQAKEYLPFPISSAGNTIVSTTANGNSFYQNLTGDTTPFSEKTFDNSPLNRVVSQAAPGNSWKKGAKEIIFSYATNIADDKVSKFGVTLSTTFAPTLTLSDYYETGTLYKTITTDENGQPIQEFKDKDGRVILKRINIPQIAGTTNSSGNHDTYYVYDIYGNLTYVLPPKLVEIGGETIANYISNMPELGYQYQYDAKNRLVEKQLPGKGREYMVYDKLDRLVATRDSQNPWVFTKYDKFGRVVYTGTLPSSARTSLQASYDSATVYNETRGASGGIANNGITNGLYTNVAYPTSFTKILSVNYYDEYKGLGVTPSAIDGQTILLESDLKLKGLPVASFTNILDTQTWNKNFTYYDQVYVRPIASSSLNYLGGYTNTASKLDFRGKVTTTVSKHKRLSSSTELTITEEFAYYPNELLKYQTHQINNGTKEYIAQNTYNEINQLVTKKVGNSIASTPLQNVDYKYNIRGWLTDINNVDVNATGTYSDLFNFRLNYDKLTQITNNSSVVALHNGNISEIIWKTTDTGIRSYSFQYDKLNRLLSSFYVKNRNEANNAYNEIIKGYDKNGNILAINRNGGNEIINPPAIDNLSYAYRTNSNKLLSVTDATTSTKGFEDGNKSGNDYDYDTNGNLIKDLNKGITKISYNHLNLPTEVLWSSTKKINYSYDASGVKLRKTVTDGSTVSTTDYLGGFQYKNNVLQFYPTSEGYVNVTNGNVFNYVYNYTDHLGNVKLSYQKENDGSLKVLEENNYYPFGLKHESYNSTILANQNYKYKYNGKELQEEFNINLYDYGARNYDPAIGRWFNIDPLAESFYDDSPFNYALNNPVYFIDPTGMSSEPNNEDDPINKKPIELETVLVTSKKSNNPYDNPNVAANATSLYSAISETPATKNIDQGMRDALGMLHPVVALIYILDDLNNGKEVEKLDYVATIPAFKIVKFQKFGTLALKSFSFADKYGIKSYSTLKVALKGTGLEAHHLIEKRFAALLGVKPSDMLSIALTKSEHQVFTNAWRAEIGYKGSNSAVTTANATKEQVINAAKTIYKDYPEILNKLGL